MIKNSLNLLKFALLIEEVKIGMSIAPKSMTRKDRAGGLNERKKFMQETQQKQQKAIRTAQNQDKERNMNVNVYKNTEDTQKQTDIY